MRRELLADFIVNVRASSKGFRPAGYPQRSLSEILENLPLDKVHIFVYHLIMKTISFYRTASGKCPVKEHLDSLTDMQATKIAWVLKLIRELDLIPSKYFKKLVNTDGIWESRVDVGKNAFRLLGFFHGR